VGDLAAEPEADPAAELAGAQRRLRRRMLWILGSAAAITGLAVGAIAVCNRPGPEVPEIARPYLWRVEVPGGAPSYLFGTLHIGYAVGDLPRAVLAAQAGARTTVIESDLLSEKPPRLRPATEGRARLEPGIWRQLAAVTGVAEEELVTWDSSRLVGVLIVRLAPRVVPMDRGLQARAVELDKPVVFLEERSLESIMNERELLSGLALAVTHRTQFRAELMTMIQRYATGEDSGCGGAGLGGLVDDLNQSWRTAIEREVRQGGAFVAIGCSHLVGSGSIVEHLRNQGLQVRRVDR
jgi:uncharacterized protein